MSSETCTFTNIKLTPPSMPSRIVRPHTKKLEVLPVFSATGTNRILSVSAGVFSPLPSGLRL
ncbi:unnamed protein product, partial [Ectocarpus sp. 13 AM-2016]